MTEAAIVIGRSAASSSSSSIGASGGVDEEVDAAISTSFKALVRTRREGSETMAKIYGHLTGSYDIGLKPWISIQRIKRNMSL